VLVDNLVVLKLKAVEALLPIHEAQLLTHLDNEWRKERMCLLVSGACISGATLLPWRIRSIPNSLTNALTSP
jgi:hypothetical protein